MAFLGVAFFAFDVWATTTRFFRQTTAKDFEEGEAISTMVAPPGEVLPGMKSTRVTIDAAFAWCSVLSRDRSTAYFGTGDRGRIFAIPTAGTTAAKMLAEIDSPWVTALVAKSDGNLLAGSTPGGQVFTVDSKTGKSKLLTKLAAEHVWALQYDQARSTTYAATGDPGQIFAIDAKGSARLVWDSGDKHVISLAMDGGTLLAGTADKAMLFRVHTDGHAIALHDFEADEVRAIVRGKGSIYLAVNDFENPADTNQPPSTEAQPAKGTRIAAGPAPASGVIARADAVKARSAIYRLDDDGRIEQLFALAEGYFTALLLDGHGNLLATSGSQGKIYRIAADRTVALAAAVPERQALSFVPAGDGYLIGSGDVGAVYRVQHAQGADATYLSKVLDAEVPARWGHVWWTGSRDLVIETRSGNTGKPDANWSAFHRIQPVTHYQGENAGSIKSQGARYIQYRAILPGRESVLNDISIYYVPHNQRARITEVYLGDGSAPALGVGGATTPSPTTVPGSTRVHSSVLKLRWKVENPDSDELIYKIRFRQVDDSVWRPLGGPDPLAKPEYDWNTDSVPDGRYVIRVWASDEKVTPADRALDHVFESAPFLVDNTKPEIQGLTVHADSVKGRIHDAASVIALVEYSVDGGDWRPVQPLDGLYDQRDEDFTIPLPKSLEAGPHIMNVRAFDSADNIGTARAEIRTGKSLSQ